MASGLWWPHNVIMCVIVVSLKCFYGKASLLWESGMEHDEATTHLASCEWNRNTWNGIMGALVPVHQSDGNNLC